MFKCSLVQYDCQARGGGVVLVVVVVVFVLLLDECGEVATAVGAALDAGRKTRFDI